MYVADKKVFDTYRLSNYGDHQWQPCSLAQVQEPTGLWLNEFITSLGIDTELFNIQPVRIIDKTARKFLINYVGSSATGTGIEGENFPDIPQLWSCPLAIQIMWKGDNLSSPESRPPIAQLRPEILGRLTDIVTDVRFPRSSDAEESHAYTRNSITISNSNRPPIQIWSSHDILRQLVGYKMKYDEGYYDIVWKLPDECTKVTNNVRCISGWNGFVRKCRNERGARDGYYYDNSRNARFQWHLGGIQGVYNHFRFNDTEIHNFLTEFKRTSYFRDCDNPMNYSHSGGRGYRGIWNVFRENQEKLYDEQPLLFCLMVSLVQNSKFKHKEVITTKIINRVLSDVTDYDSLVASLRAFWEKSRYVIKESDAYGQRMFLRLLDADGTADIIQEEARIAKYNKAVTKLFGDMGHTLKTAKRRYPFFVREFEAGQIPIDTFRRSRSTQLYNANLNVWEKMLKLDAHATTGIAQRISRLVGPNRNIMSYFNFVLTDFPRYLKKMTGETWTVLPKYQINVDTTSVSYAGNVIVDNINKIVTVPYCVDTTYRYRSTVPIDWNILKKGESFDGDKALFGTKVISGHTYGLFYNNVKREHTGRADQGLTRVYLCGFIDGNVTIDRVKLPRNKYGVKPINGWIDECHDVVHRGLMDYTKVDCFLFKKLPAPTAEVYAYNATHLGDTSFSTPIMHSDTYQDAWGTGTVGNIRVDDTSSTVVTSPSGATATLTGGEYQVFITNPPNRGVINTSFYNIGQAT